MVIARSDTLQNFCFPETKETSAFFQAALVCWEALTTLNDLDQEYPMSSCHFKVLKMKQLRDKKC